MIAVVTGSSGFIGSHLVDALLARGAEVRAIVRPGSRPSKGNAGVEVHHVDLCNEHDTRRAAVWNGATHVFHLAGLTRARALAQFREANVRPTEILLSALAGRSTPPRVVLISSQAAAGPTPLGSAFVTEDDEPRPVEAYGASKLEAERVTAKYADRVPTVILRPSSVYGPRDRDFLNAFREASSRVAFYAAPSGQQISILHVRDLVTGILASADHPLAPGKTFFLANETAITWQNLYGIVAAIAGVSPVGIQLPPSLLRAAAATSDLIASVTGRTPLLNRHKVALTEPRKWTCSPARAQGELGWRAREDLHAGVRETYLWYVDAKWLRRDAPSPDMKSTGEPKT